MLHAPESDDAEPCESQDCPSTWDVACPHGRWCLSHARRHGAQDESCNRAFDAAIATLFGEGILPTLERLRSRPPIVPVSSARLEGEMFPVRTSWLEVIKTLEEVDGLMAEHYRQTAARLEGALDRFTSYLRERFEGEAMPPGLTDAEAWRWYRDYARAQEGEH